MEKGVVPSPAGNLWGGKNGSVGGVHHGLPEFVAVGLQGKADAVAEGSAA